MLGCPNCAAEIAPDQRFCGYCGQAIDATCQTCGAPLQPGHRFCATCGAAVYSGAANAADGANGANGALSATGGDPGVGLAAGPVTERRLCSVLFVDLVGFTPLSESRDAEEVRELLSSYFATTRAIVERYGGVIEKFIGDAVMAVWGTPVASEGDAERAVRASLDIVAAVALLGESVGIAGLAARGGVVTGEVAAALGAATSGGEGMVAGDAVNTAARVQSVAPPGGVLVDGATRRLASLGIAFDQGTAYVLKGKAEPETLWRATQVVSGVGGSQRVDGLEAPFVGREVEFRLVKDLLHATVTERQPRLIVVSGAAGVGKSRLGWEFEKYIDGLADSMLWHRGRCLPFGEDIAFWALAEIIRARIGASDDDGPDAVATKLRARLDEVMPSQAERDYVFERMTGLLGLADASGLAASSGSASPSSLSTPSGSSAAALPREELFAGWRLFFERLAAESPVLLLVEDVQYADVGMLDFIEHLVDWSRDVPLVVLAFTRPDLEVRRPGFGVGRHRTLINLEPLGQRAMRTLLDGLVPQMPADAADAIAEQAQGIPLFAVETIRSLIDQDVVIPQDGVYTLVADVGELQVPESLHSLLAARIDALDPESRSLVSDAAVLGCNFMRETIDAMSQLPPQRVDRALSELVRRDVLQISADELSPQMGSYSFTHGLLSQVAYSTMSHRDVKVRHLRAAKHLEDSPRNEGDALAEVIARHHLDALAARPDDDDVLELRRSAASWLIRAGKRAGRNGAQSSAARLLATAAGLTEDADPIDLELTGAPELDAVELWHAAARAALTAADGDLVVSHAARAADIGRRRGDLRSVARSQALAGRGLQMAGRAVEARAMLVEAVAVLEVDPAEDTVAAMSDLAGADAMSAHPDRDDMSMRALELGQELGVTGALMADLLMVRGLVHGTYDRRVQAAAYFREALRVAEDAGETLFANRALGNLGDAISPFDPEQAVAIARESARRARQIGARFYLLMGSVNTVVCAMLTGAWDEAEQVVDSMLGPDGISDMELVHPTAAVVWALRGDCERARDIMERDTSEREEPQDVSFVALARAILAYAEGEHAAALAHAHEACVIAAPIGLLSDNFRLAWPLAARVAYEVGDSDASEQLLAMVRGRKSGHLSPLLVAERALAEARLLSDPDERDRALAAAVASTRLTGLPYYLAHALLDLAEHRASNGADPSALIDEASEIASRLSAAQVRRRVDQLTAQPLSASRLTAPRSAAARTSP